MLLSAFHFMHEKWIVPSIHRLSHELSNFHKKLLKMWAKNNGLFSVFLQKTWLEIHKWDSNSDCRQDVYNADPLTTTAITKDYILTHLPMDLKSGD